MGVSYGATIVLSILFQETLPIIGSLGDLLARLLSGLLILLCLAIAAKIHRSFPKEHARASQFPRLYTDGPYAHCRHPLYLSLIILQFLIAIYMWSLEGLLVWLLTLSLWYVLIRAEEKELVSHWGSLYREYMTQVPRLIPLRRSKNKSASGEK
jgi:protein-S-isoprenylcysteine O-methyltransferase Ste14